MYVTMEITAGSWRDREAHLDPFDFVLQDGAGVKHRLSFVPSCPSWQAVNLTKGSGVTGKCLGFEAAADRPQRLVLVWTPDLGGGDHDVELS